VRQSFSQEQCVGSGPPRADADAYVVRVFELSIGHTAWYWVHDAAADGPSVRLKFALRQGRLLLGDDLLCVGVDLSYGAAEQWLRGASEQERAAVRTAKVANPEDLPLVELLPGLRALECSSVSDEDLQWLCSRGLELAFLYVSWSSRLSTLEPLGGMRSLLRLVVSDCLALEDITALSRLKRLQSLEIINADHVRKLGPLASLEGLRRLALRNCDGIEDLRPLASLRELRHLDLSRCNRVRDLGPLAGLKALVSLDLSDCNAIRDLSPLRSLDNLEDLRLFGCNRVEDLTPLYHMCYLRSLSLPNETQDGDLLAICKEHPELERLDLRNCQKVTDLSSLVRTRHIKHLTLAGCRNVTDLSPLAALEGLIRLDLAHCVGITSLRPLHGLKRLQDLYIGGCVNLPARERIEFKRACPGCRVHAV